MVRSWSPVTFNVVAFTPPVLNVSIELATVVLFSVIASRLLVAPAARDTMMSPVFAPAASVTPCKLIVRVSDELDSAASAKLIVVTLEFVLIVIDGIA